jgi:hypothetical protein
MEIPHSSASGGSIRNDISLTVKVGRIGDLIFNKAAFGSSLMAILNLRYSAY